MGVIFNDYSDEVLEAFDEGCLRALERCGLQAEGYAKDLCPAPHSTGNLRNSISHKVIDSAEPTAYIGTNCEYAHYVEFGTGHYATTGGGTPKTHWAYIGNDGKWHIGPPMKARPYLTPAVAHHVGTYRNTFTDELSK